MVMDTLHLVASLLLLAVLVAMTWRVVRCELARRTERLDRRGAEEPSADVDACESEAA
jgi:hypothetical protein